MDVEQALRSIQAGVDELDARIDALEDNRTYAMTAGAAVEQRRRIVERMRREGMSIQRIALVLDVPDRTIAYDVQRLGVRRPDRVLGADGRVYDVTRCNGNGLGQPTSR